jgi:hypothetical protein
VLLRNRLAPWALLPALANAALIGDPYPELRHGLVRLARPNDPESLLFLGLLLIAVFGITRAAEINSSREEPRPDIRRAVANRLYSDDPFRATLRLVLAALCASTAVSSLSIATGFVASAAGWTSVLDVVLGPDTRIGRPWFADEWRFWPFAHALLLCVGSLTAAMLVMMRRRAGAWAFLALLTASMAASFAYQNVQAVRNAFEPVRLLGYGPPQIWLVNGFMAWAMFEATRPRRDLATAA